MKYSSVPRHPFPVPHTAYGGSPHGVGHIPMVIASLRGGARYPLTAQLPAQHPRVDTQYVHHLTTFRWRRDERNGS